MAVDPDIQYGPPIEDTTVSSGDTSEFTKTTSTTNATSDVVTIRHRSTGTPAAGIGAGLVFETEDAGGADQVIAKLRPHLSTATAGSEVGRVRLAIVDGGTVPAEGAEKFTFTGAGHLGIGTAATALDPTAELHVSLANGDEEDATIQVDHADAERRAQVLLYHSEASSWLISSLFGSAAAGTMHGINRAGNVFLDVLVAAGKVFSLGTNAARDVQIVTNNTTRIKATGTGSVVLQSAAVATNATDGFVYDPTCAGTPTGTPTTHTGTQARVIDTTNDIAYRYSSVLSAWTPIDTLSWYDKYIRRGLAKSGIDPSKAIIITSEDILSNAWSKTASITHVDAKGARYYVNSTGGETIIRNDGTRQPRCVQAGNKAYCAWIFKIGTANVSAATYFGAGFANGSGIGFFVGHNGGATDGTTKYAAYTYDGAYTRATSTITIDTSDHTGEIWNDGSDANYDFSIDNETAVALTSGLGTEWLFPYIEKNGNGSNAFGGEIGAAVWIFEAQ